MTVGHRPYLGLPDLHCPSVQIASTTYGAVSRAIRYLGDIPPHPQVSTFTLQFPTSHEEILENWRNHIHLVTSQRNDLQQTRKVVAVIDAIVANPGVRLPWKEMVAICRDAGVWSVVDAAHSIGQEVDINLSEAKPDFWVSVGPNSCHLILDQLTLNRIATSGFSQSVGAQYFMFLRGMVQIFD